MQDSTPRGNEEEKGSSHLNSFGKELSLLVEVLQAIKAHINDKRK